MLVLLLDLHWKQKRIEFEGFVLQINLTTKKVKRFLFFENS